MPRKEQIPVSDPNTGIVCHLNLSKDVQTLSVSHGISGKHIEHPIVYLYFIDNIIIVTGRTSIDMESGEVKVIKVEENKARKSFRFGLMTVYKVYLACETDQDVCFSDQINHCIYKIDF